jgi:hypothetical protein
MGEKLPEIMSSLLRKQCRALDNDIPISQCHPFCDRDKVVFGFPLEFVPAMADDDRKLPWFLLEE